MFLPEVDQRVDDLRAVMDAVDVERAFLFGTSEGGPMTLLYAATYPDRVAGIILDGSGARLIDREQAEPDDGRQEGLLRFADAWGTPETLTPELFAPSLVDDPEFRAWHAGYERQSASRDAIVTLMRMNGLMDARDVLPRITVPVLLLHRTDDPITPVRFAHETAAALPDARVVEFPGADHFMYAADIDAIMDTIEHFVTGTVSTAPVRRSRPQVEIFVLGRFAVTVDGDEVDPSAWGSRRARQLLKRLVVAEGWPVTRDELCDLLWPDEPDHDRLRPRLSVQLSTVRRILDGGVVADRSTIRLDVDHVRCDLVAFNRLDDPLAIYEAYPGDLLPDDEYEDWAAPPRAAARNRFLIAARQLIDQALERGEPLEAAAVGSRILTLDPYDDPAHCAVIAGLHTGGSHGAAREAYVTYQARMTELGVEADDFDAILLPN
ncbi:MAG: alpha/beta fold hydrolase [Ilumatobacteraceae bacterium]|nr:alpha/beta fold hydrolase [Ilumatobacteraceae bacterium]